jgi:HlyD family secretion protein
MKTWVVLIVLAAGAAGGFLYYQSTPAQASSELITADVTRGSIVETVQSTGSLEAVTTVLVGSQVSGSIKSLYVDFNSQVRAGQVIAELDPSLFETQVEQARASVVKFEADLDRAKVQVDDSQLKLTRSRELAGRQLIPSSELETAESAARQAQSAVKSAEAQIVQATASLNQSQVNLNHTIIKAPIDGIVVSRDVDVGQTVAASMSAPTLFVIAQDMTQMQVSAAIDESDIGRIESGQAVTFRVDAYPDDQFLGTVRQVRLQPVVEQNVVSYTTIISVPNPELKLRPGMTATVTVEIARADDTLRVPTGAFRFRPTAEAFALLGQAVPPGMRGGRGEFGGRSTPRGDATAPRAVSSSPETSAGPTGLWPHGGGSGASGGAGGARRAVADGAPASAAPAQREQMRERMQQMSAEERQQMRGRFEPGAGGGAGGARRAVEDGASVSAPGTPGVTTRPVWVLNAGRLERVEIRTGISDGIVQAVVGGPLEQGSQVVTGVTEAREVAAQRGGNPLMPSFGRRSRGGGRR